MITNYQILADSSCDLPFSLARSLGVSYAPLRVQFQGAEYENFLDGDPRSRLDIKAFYSALRTGTPTSTTAVNPEGWSALMTPVLEAGQDILVLAFSSGLSSTYAAAVLAAQELGSRYPARTIRVVDTLCASMGQGLLIYHAVQRQRAGESLEQVTDFVEANKLHLCHWFTVDDLMFLYRGGRVSRTAAFAGSLLNIKPVLHVDDEGRLIPVEKTRGRMKSIRRLFEHFKETFTEPLSDQTLAISHGDCIEDALTLKKMIEDEYGPQKFIINYVDPVIGAHSGPGTLAFFFMGSHR